MASNPDASGRLALDQLKARLRTLLQEAPAAQAESVDGVHDLRVASRRLRAALQLYKPLFRKKPRKRLADLARSITKALGRARELDVMLGLLDEEPKPKGKALAAALRSAQAHLKAEREKVAQPCRDAAALAMGPEFEEAVWDLFAGWRGQQRALRSLARRQLRTGLEAVWEAFDAWQVQPDGHTLHQVRIATKKFRYQCELHAPLYADGLEPLIAELKQLQDHLGHWNDYRVLREELAPLATDSAASATRALGYQELLARIDQYAASYLESFAHQAPLLFDAQHREKALARIRTRS